MQARLQIAEREKGRRSQCAYSPLFLRHFRPLRQLPIPHSSLLRLSVAVRRPLRVLRALCVRLKNSPATPNSSLPIPNFYFLFPFCLLAIRNNSPIIFNISSSLRLFPFSPLYLRLLLAFFTPLIPLPILPRPLHTVIHRHRQHCSYDYPNH